MTAPLPVSHHPSDPDAPEQTVACAHCLTEYPEGELRSIGGDLVCRGDFLVEYAKRGAAILAHGYTATEEDLRELDQLTVDARAVLREVEAEVARRLQPAPVSLVRWNGSAS